MALRPSQIRATSMDGALMIPGALRLRRRYDELSMPVLIMAGSGDKIVFKRNAERLQASIPGSGLRIVEGAGHMVHHSVPGQVVEAIQQVAAASTEASVEAPCEPARPSAAAPEGLARAA
jgi:pimeloyl-ACP methyl ester carboxylesterase